MKRRLLFLSMIALVSVVMLSVSSCTKDLKDDVKDLQKDVKDLQADVNALKAAGSLGKVVSNVTSNSSGGLTITFSDGSTTTVNLPTTTTVKYPSFDPNSTTTL